MSTAPHATGPEGAFSPPAYLAALRQAGPVALAEALAGLASLLQDIAGDPGTIFELDGAARDDFSVLLGNLRTCGGAMDALEARAVIALRDATRGERHAAARDRAAQESGAVPSRSRTDEEADGATAEDISLITRRSPHMAGRTLASAERLIDCLPRMMDALRTGRISSDAAYAVAGAASVLDPDLSRAVDRALSERLADFDGAGTRRWRDAVAVIAGELDPDGAILRHRRALRERHVTMTPAQNGMATVSARVAAIEARRIHKRLTLEAERRRAAGARAGHGAVMADAFTDILLGRSDGTAGPGTLDVGVIITDRALFRPDAGDVAHLEGYGPVPAEAVRAQLRGVTAAPDDPARDPFGADGPVIRATIRRLYRHPIVGELVGMDARAREFPPAMRRFLSWRDSSCRGPFCNAAVRQADHIVPVSRGGPTSLDNGQGLCAHCNQKETSTAKVERLVDPERPGHRVAWTGHAGTCRVTSPTPLIWPRRLEPPSGEDGGEGEEGPDQRSSGGPSGKPPPGGSPAELPSGGPGGERAPGDPGDDPPPGRPGDEPAPGGPDDEPAREDLGGDPSPGEPGDEPSPGAPGDEPSPGEPDDARAGHRSGHPDDEQASEGPAQELTRRRPPPGTAPHRPRRAVVPPPGRSAPAATDAVGPDRGRRARPSDRRSHRAGPAVDPGR